MAKRRKKSIANTVQRKTDSIMGALWKFVEQNPQVALAIAFEIGALINEATRNRGNVKAMLLKQIEKGADLLPQLLAGQENKIPPALKILAGPALQAALVAGGTPQAKARVKVKRPKR